MKKLIVSIIAVLMFCGISMAESIRILSVERNVDKYDGKTYSVTIEYEEYYEMIQFTYDEDGNMYETVPHSILPKNFFEQGGF